MSKFLIAESPMDGGDSDKINQKPSKSSLIFITTFVNTRKTKILIDTGATTTFINTKVLQYMKHLRHTPYSLLLADGLAPFYVLGVVELSIQFANTTTKVQAHIAKNLCADMIIGMDYINFYNLNINIMRQVVSIHHHNHTFTMNIDKDFILHKIPVTLQNPGLFLLTQTVQLQYQFLSHRFLLYLFLPFLYILALHYAQALNF